MKKKKFAILVLLLALIMAIPTIAMAQTLDDVPQRTENSTVYFALRLTAYAHGAAVEWNGETRTVYITDAGGNRHDVIVEAVGGFIEHGTSWVPRGIVAELFPRTNGFSEAAADFIADIEEVLPIENMQAAGTWPLYLELVENAIESAASIASETELFLWERGFGARLQHYWVDNFSEDAFIIVDTFERAHPIFIMADIAERYNLDGLPVLTPNYQENRDAFLYFAQGYITRAEFVFAAKRYLVMMQDGHLNSHVFAIFDAVFGGPFLAGGFVDMLFTYRNGNLYLLDEQGRITASRVVEIGGTAARDIFNQLDLHYFPENATDRGSLYSMGARYIPMINKAGGQDANGVIDVLVSAGNVNTVIQADIIALPLETLDEQADFIIEYRMIDDDIFLIDLRAFVDGPHIDSAMVSIAEAVENGVRHFILDLRDNGGGSSLVGERLLSAMGVELQGEPGKIWRFSDVYTDFVEFILEIGFFHGDMVEQVEEMILEFRELYPEPGYTFTPSYLAIPDNPNDVFVSVLTNIESYSAATMIAYMIQDSRLGNVIGTPSRNAPSSFGEGMFLFLLPDSYLSQIFVSTAWFLRLDQNAPQHTVVPDILVEDDDALYAAVEFLRGLD